MYLSSFMMLIHELLNKDPNIVPEEDPLNILDRNSAVCIAKNGIDTNQTRHISRRARFVINGEKFKTHQIDWCKIGLKLTDIANRNVGENDLNPIMKYILVWLDNW